MVEFFHVKADAGNKWDTFTVLGAGVAVDLTTASAVKLWMTNELTGVNKIAGGACVVEDATNGLVSYTPVAADVNMTDWNTAQTADGYARYLAEFEVEWPSGLPDRFPSDGFFFVDMTADLE